MCKDTNIFSEISKYFKENDAASAISTIMDMTHVLKISEKKLFNTESKVNSKYSQLQVFELLLLFPCFMVKNAYNYSSSVLSSIADCRKDVFYRFLSREDYNWREILLTISTQLWHKVQKESENTDNDPVCLMIDDTDYPKTGLHTELIGKIYSHVEHKMILGFKGLFLGITDGKSQMLMDFCLVGEKGKNGKHCMSQKQIDARLAPKRSEDSVVADRIKEYDESKITLMMEMIKRLIKRKIHFDYILADSWFACADIVKFITARHIKCHYLGMIKMGKTKYRYNRKDYTAKGLLALLSKSRTGRKYSRRLGCYYVKVDVMFANRKVRLFFVKRNKNSEWNGLLTTNTDLDFFEAYRIYSMRWSLEVIFKDSKSNLGLGKYQVRNFASQIACTSITAIQYNLLSTARRFSDYETIGGLFKEATRNSIELTITDRIWDMILSIVNEIALCFEMEDEKIFNLLINKADKLKNFVHIYNIKMAS